MEHDLKTWPVFFQAILDGDKAFEARRNDRNFEADDWLLLREWDPTTGDYTGRSIRRRVGFILRGPGYGIETGYCVMSLADDVPEPGCEVSR